LNTELLIKQSLPTLFDGLRVTIEITVISLIIAIIIGLIIGLMNISFKNNSDYIYRYSKGNSSYSTSIFYIFWIACSTGL